MPRSRRHGPNRRRGGRGHGRLCSHQGRFRLATHPPAAPLLVGTTQCRSLIDYPNTARGTFAEGLGAETWIARRARQQPEERGMSMEVGDLVMSELSEIKSLLAALVERQTIKDWYTTEEVARLTGRDEWTV